MSSPAHRGKWILGAILTVTAAGSAFAFIPNASGSQSSVQSVMATDSSQVAAVKATFTAAITADREMQAPAASTSYEKSANTAVSAGKTAPTMSAADRDTQSQNGKAALAKYFSPGQAKHEEVGLTNAVNAEADPKFRNLGSGVKNLKFDNVAVSGNTATLTAEVTTWAKFQQQQPNGDWATASPVNVMTYTATMTLNSSGQWIVSSMTGDFAPGEGP